MLALVLITLKYVVSQFTSSSQKTYKLAATKCGDDGLFIPFRCYNANKSAMNGSPSVSNTTDYVKMKVMTVKPMAYSRSTKVSAMHWYRPK